MTTTYLVDFRDRRPRGSPELHLVEKSVFGFGSWAETNDDHVHILTLKEQNNEDGGMRYTAGGHSFFVVFGMCDRKLWVHIMPDLPNGMTGLAQHQTYHQGSNSGIAIETKSTEVAPGRWTITVSANRPDLRGPVITTITVI